MTGTNFISFFSCVDFIWVLLLNKLSFFIFLIPINKLMWRYGRRIYILLPYYMLLRPRPRLFLYIPILSHLISSRPYLLTGIPYLCMLKPLDSWLKHTCVFRGLLDGVMSRPDCCLALGEVQLNVVRPWAGGLDALGWSDPFAHVNASLCPWKKRRNAEFKGVYFDFGW